MAFLKYKHSISTAHQTVADPNEVNDNLDDIARLVNGNLGAENLAVAAKVAATQLECGRSYVTMHFDFGSAGLPTSVTTKKLFKSYHVMKLVAVGVCGAASSGATSWTIYNGATAMCSFMIGKDNNYIHDGIQNSGVAVGDTISLTTVCTTGFTGLTLFFTVAHQ